MKDTCFQEPFLRSESDKIEAECARLLYRMFFFLDERRYDELSDLFHPDGCWNRKGEALRGPEAIRREMNKRPPTLRVRHIVTNVMVNPIDAASADFVLYLTAYMHDTARETPAAAPLIGPTLLLVVTGCATDLTHGWRIKEMTMRREFEFGPPLIPDAKGKP